jgi:hypothetical protein
MSENTVKYVIEIVDKWGKPLSDFQKSTENALKKKLPDPFRDMPRSVSRLKENLERYKKAADDSLRLDHVKKYNRLIKETNKRLKALEGTAQSSKSKLSGLFDNVGVSSKMLGAGALLYGLKQIGDVALSAVKESAKFEKYTVTLKTMLGSQGAARERMQEYTDIAASTPFELSQVVEAGNQLQAIGRYNRENLTMLGDLASASGKPIEQVMGAYAKLSTGQKGEAVNMFRDLLISTDDWTKATGKGIAKNGELIAGTEEMIKALPKILKDKGFFGMMSEQAKTTEGRISNLKDSISALNVAAGDRMKPAFDKFISGTTSIVTNLKRWVEVPTAEKIAKEKAELNTLVGIITNANTGEKTRSDLITELQQKYPEFLKGIDLETIKNEDLRKKLVEVNKEYENKMRLASMKDFVSAEEDKLQNLYNENIRLSTVRGSSVAMEDMERSITEQFGIKSSKTYSAEYGSQGSSFEENLRTAKKRYDKIIATQPDDTKARSFLDMYYKYIGYANIQKEYGKLLEGGGILEDKISANNEEIKVLQNQVNIFKGNLDKEQRANILERAKAINPDDKSTYKQLFGKQILQNEFLALRDKGSTAMDTVTPEEWQRMADFVDGKLAYTKSSGGGGTGGQGAIDRASAVIDGGGKSVKQYNITIDNLIGMANNYFRSTDTLAGGENFMQQLTNALQMVVNDVNYG